MDGNHLGAQALLGLVSNLPFFFRIYWLPLLALAIIYGGKYFFAQQELRRLAAIGIEDMDTLDGKAFEKYLEIRFRQTGYCVTRTRYVKDYGADLVLEKAGVKTVVQAKRWKKAVGIGAVQEVVASQAKYGCTHAMVVTNSTFTSAAVELAACNRVELWGRERLLTELLSIQLAPLTPAAAPKPSSTPVERPAAFDRQFAASTLAENPADALLLPARTEAFCAACGKSLTPKVEAYCRNNLTRFGGRVLCYEHQKAANSYNRVHLTDG